MENIIFWVFGGVIVLIDALALWKPRNFIEWSERQLIYKRERIVAGSIFVLLGAIPLYFILPLAGWQSHLLSIIGGIFIILGLLTLLLPDMLRNMFLSLGALDDKKLRIFFAIDALFGIILILLGF